MRIFATILILTWSFGAGLAQDIATQPYIPKMVVDQANCESNLSQLGILNQYTKGGRLIIILSHSGRKERNDINERRLFNAKKLFTHGFKVEFNRPAESIILGDGAMVEGRGFLDFYVEGQLELRIFFKRNSDLLLGQCVLNFPYEKPCSTSYAKLFYPCKDKR